MRVDYTSVIQEAGTLACMTEPSARDEHVSLPLDPEEALRALLAVKPEDEPADDGNDHD